MIPVGPRALWASMGHYVGRQRTWELLLLSNGVPQGCGQPHTWLQAQHHVLPRFC